MFLLTELSYSNSAIGRIRSQLVNLHSCTKHRSSPQGFYWQSQFVHQLRDDKQKWTSIEYSSKAIRSLLKIPSKLLIPAGDYSFRQSMKAYHFLKNLVLPHAQRLSSWNKEESAPFKKKKWLMTTKVEFWPRMVFGNPSTYKVHA